MHYQQSRRQFLSQTASGFGMMAMTDLLGQHLKAAERPQSLGNGVLGGTHFAPRAKRVIYLFQSGGPSHLDLFDYKPLLKDQHGKDMPPSVLGRRE